MQKVKDREAVSAAVGVAMIHLAVPRCRNRCGCSSARVEGDEIAEGLQDEGRLSVRGHGERKRRDHLNERIIRCVRCV